MTATTTNQGEGREAAAPFQTPQSWRAQAGRATSLTRLEARMLLRRRGTVISALFVPLLLVAVLLINSPDTAAGWAVQTGQFVVIALLITVYLPTATVLTARRETQVFKRMRTSEVGPLGLLTAIIVPLAIIGVLQGAVVAAAVLFMGAPPPQQPALLIIGVTLSLVLAITLGVAIAALTKTSEQVQFTTTPVLIGAAVAAQLVATSVPEDVRLGALAVPMAAGSSLVARAWGGPEATPAMTLGLPSTLVEVLLLLAWTAVAALLAHRVWRWEPRG